MGKKIEETIRGKFKRKINPAIVIICEGSKTEPIYFSHFKNRYSNIQVPSPNNSKGNKTDYTHIIDKAIKYMKKNDLTFEDGDVAWCVFDADVDYKTYNSAESKNSQLQEVLKTAKDSSININIALSIPCFEIWYILHYKYITCNFTSSSNVKSYLQRECMEGYSKNKDVFDSLKPLLLIAIENAKKLKRYHEKNGIINFFDVKVSPYTNIWELVEKLLEINKGI